MNAWLISVMNRFGYFGICFLIALENIFPPIPSEVILTFSGFMTTTTKLTIPLVILFSTLGSTIGALLLYYIGRILNKDRLIKLVSGRLGRLIRLKPKDILKADQWFNNRGNITVFFCRFIPIIRSLISIPAGMSEMPLTRFLLYTITGTLIWNSVLVLLGYYMGSNWLKISIWLEKFSYAVVISIVLIIVICFFIIRRKKALIKQNTR